MLFVSLEPLFVSRRGAELAEKSPISRPPTTTVVGGRGFADAPPPPEEKSNDGCGPLCRHWTQGTDCERTPPRRPMVEVSSTEKALVLTPSVAPIKAKAVHHGLGTLLAAPED